MAKLVYKGMLVLSKDLQPTILCFYLTYIIAHALYEYL